MPTSDQYDVQRGSQSRPSLQVLQRFVQGQEGRRSASTSGTITTTTTQPAEHCEFCSTPLMTDHRHVLNLTNREILCSCNACTLLFDRRGAGDGRHYRSIPQRYQALPNFVMDDRQWDALAIPVGMVYLFYNTLEQRVQAFYPSPAGATESLLHLDQWAELLRDNPPLQSLEADVEALLINRVNEARDYAIVPIDVCYQLVGLMRMSWRGLSGGPEVWQAIAAFFADIQTRAE